MKKIGLYFRLTLALLIVTAVQLSAQDVVEFPEINTLTAENIFHATVEPLYSALIVLFGYASSFIPGIQKFSKFTRVLAFALVAGLGFHLFGASIWKVAITYALSTAVLYDGFLSRIKIPRKKASPSA